MVDDKEEKGIVTYKNSNVYEGDFLNDHIIGQGVMTYDNGDKYEGGKFWL